MRAGDEVEKGNKVSRIDDVTYPVHVSSQPGQPNVTRLRDSGSSGVRGRVRKPTVVVLWLPS